MNQIAIIVMYGLAILWLLLMIWKFKDHSTEEEDEEAKERKMAGNMANRPSLKTYKINLFHIVIPIVVFLAIGVFLNVKYDTHLFYQDTVTIHSLLGI